MKEGQNIRVAIIGSRKWSDEQDIIDVIQHLKNKFGDDLSIVSGEAALGVDSMAKRASLKLEVDYVAFPPAHARWNIYCLRENFMYGKKYSPRNFFVRNDEIAEYCHYMIAYLTDGDKCSGTWHAISCARKRNKKVLIFSK